ncbi:hypothetical protein TPHA_0K00600 [Tetrapisispora phaffii CBS 4417]|uniref:Cyclin-like domain-containing protein n=1 Tax=Tetrapisispora phaffii (strain ATCC 24235 / CBS 4417 / NBRC 1672 / NRRL Y-8282 / UCD 70-5) TaxID=1071381 RepID=G8BZ66_TETPH|nr:hypothetical protein TPHA_0K00600 [Tetrapisispora phaffii CBS 4417]CCE65194.1 hypothetical protein TPHA_0K00600 [Tetrapisispora phaffii CBS 4417]
MSVKQKKKVLEKPEGYKVISDDDLFRSSSQYRLWSFTKEQLDTKRVDTNAHAVAAIEEKLTMFKKDYASDISEEDAKMINEKAIPLTAEEELKLVDFYAKKVQGIAQHLNLPTEVVSSALIFFKRFYLENSVMEIDPKTIVHTIIFLACKSENYFISVDSFSKKTKASRDTILKYEFRILESLKFSLLCHHPFKPLHGFFLDIQNVLHGKVDVKYMGEIYTKTKKRISDALLTDVAFLFTPPQITLAALSLEDEQLTEKYLETKFSNTDTIIEASKDTNEKDKDSEVIKEDRPDKINYILLLSLIDQCKEVMSNPSQVSMEEAKSSAAKLYFCNHPMNIIQRNKKTQPDGTDSKEESPVKKQKI